MMCLALLSFIITLNACFRSHVMDLCCHLFEHWTTSAVGVSCIRQLGIKIYY